jgi:hypothetical protein
MMFSEQQKACFYYAAGLETCYDCNMRLLIKSNLSHMHKSHWNLLLRHILL